MVPGMDHCGAGNAFAEFDLMSTVVDWVETGKTPAAVLSARTPPKPAVLVTKRPDKNLGV